MVTESVAKTANPVEGSGLSDVEVFVGPMMEGLVHELSCKRGSDDLGPVVDSGQCSELRQDLCGKSVIGMNLDLATRVEVFRESLTDPIRQLGGRLIGESDPKDLLRLNVVVLDQVGYHHCHGCGLTGSRPGPHPDGGEAQVEDLSLLGGGCHQAHGR